MSNESQASDRSAEHDQDNESGLDGQMESTGEGNPTADAGGDPARLAEENWNKYLRAVAELDNLRKRNARDVENARKFGVDRLAGELLPVLDGLEAGLKAAEEADSATLQVETLLEGERATLRLLEQALESAGVVAIEPEGEPFDPARHEAISMQPSQSVEPGSVLMVVQKGYTLNERVLRPARVIVAQEPSE